MHCWQARRKKPAQQEAARDGRENKGRQQKTRFAIAACFHEIFFLLFGDMCTKNTFQLRAIKRNYVRSKRNTKVNSNFLRKLESEGWRCEDKRLKIIKISRCTRWFIEKWADCAPTVINRRREEGKKNLFQLMRVSFNKTLEKSFSCAEFMQKFRKIFLSMGTASCVCTILMPFFHSHRNIIS